MIKKLLFSLLVFANCFGIDKKPGVDPFAWIEDEFNKPNNQPQTQPSNPNNAQGNQAEASNSENRPDIAHQDQNPVKQNQFVLYWGTDKTKLFEKYINTNIQRAAILFASAFLGVYSARALLQKKPHFKVYFLFASSILSFFYNKELVNILNTKTGKLSLTALTIIYLHKEISQTLLPTEIFNLIYKNRG